MSTDHDIILSSTPSSKKHYVKNIWSNQEDSILNKAVSRVGAFNWNVIATLLSGRTAKQCRERWHNHLNVGIRKGEWSAAEDKILFESQSELGNQWSKISKLLEGRSDTDTKNRFYVLKRAQKRSADHIDDNSNVKSVDSYVQNFSDSPIDSVSRLSQSSYIRESNDGISNNYHNDEDEFVPIKSGSSKSLVSNDSYYEQRTQYFTYHDDEYIPPNSSSSKSLVSTDSYKAECYGRTKHFTYHDDEYVPPQQNQTGSTKSFHSAATPYTQETQSYKRNRNVFFTNYYDDEYVPSQTMAGISSSKSILSTDSYKAECYEGNKDYQNCNFKNHYNETVISPDQFGSSKSLVSTDSHKAECYEQNLYSPSLSPFTYIPSMQSGSSKSFIKINSQKNVPFVFNDKPHSTVLQSSGSTKSILLTDSYYKSETPYESSGDSAMGPVGSNKGVPFTFQNNVYVPTGNPPVQSSVSSKSLHSATPLNVDYYESTNNSTNHYMSPPAPLQQLPSQPLPVMKHILPPNSLYRIEYYDKKAVMYQNSVNVLRTSNISPVITSNDMNTIQPAFMHSHTVNHGSQQINNENINNSQSNLVTEHDVDFFAHFENQFINESENLNVHNTGNKTADYSNSTQEQEASLNYFSDDYEEILGYLASESAEMYDTNSA